MPKQRITKEMVVEAAFNLAREGGIENVLVKNIAERLGCSVQPVYCYCRNMEELKKEVAAYTGRFMKQYLEDRVDTDDFFRSLGRIYAAFAREEPHLYRLYFLRKRENVNSLEDIFSQEANPATAGYIMKQLGVTRKQAEALYKNMIIFNTGLSFILSSLGEKADIDEIDRLTQGAYNAFVSQCMKSEP